MPRKFLALALAAVTALTVVACDGSGSNDDGGRSPLRPSYCDTELRDEDCD